MTQDEAWRAPKPDRIPRPTYCPVTMALGFVLMVWAPLASWMLLGAGGALVALAVVCWINELRREHLAS